MKTIKDGKVLLACDFCGSLQKDDPYAAPRFLIAGPAAVCICESCVGVAAREMLARDTKPTEPEASA